mgnify:CR=1 FL=1
MKEELVGAVGATEPTKAVVTVATRAAGAAAGARVAKEVGASGTTRAVVTVATRAAGAAAGVRTNLGVKQAILDIEEILARVEEETEGVEFTRAFFIGLILGVLWRRALS